MTEPETVEIPEEVHDPAAVLKKNRELLADLKATKERAAALEEVARDLGLDDAALADPRGHIAKRAESTKAAEHRARVVREAVLAKVIDEGRTVTGTVEELVQKVLADPSVTLDGGGKVTGLDSALRVAPKKAAPGPPPGWSYMTVERPAAPKTLEELQARGPDAVKVFSERSPEVYEELRADFQRRLGKGERSR